MPEWPGSSRSPIAPAAAGFGAIAVRALALLIPAAVLSGIVGAFAEETVRHLAFSPAPPLAAPGQGWATLMHENFEGEFPAPGWQLAGNRADVTWGKRDCRPHGGSYSVWSHGGGTTGAGTACGSPYPNDLQSYLVYGPFSLEGVTDAEVDLAYWAETEADADSMLILLSVDADNWAGWSLSGSTQGWQAQTLSLPDADVPGGVLGRPQVWLALGLESNASVGLEGAFFDDVSLRARGGAVPTPDPSATTTAPATPVATPAPGEWTTLVKEGFEGSFPPPGWVVESTNETVTWGKSRCRSTSGEYGAWGHGGGSLGSSFSCGTDYPADLETWLVYGPMPFSEVTAAELELWVWAAIEENGDPFRLMVSTDGETYYGWVLARGTVYWYTDTFDLDEAGVPGGAVGQPQVWLAFIFASNSTIAYEGVFVDDVELRVKYGAARPTPGPGEPTTLYLPFCDKRP